jgi:hypothetical protein
MNNYVIQAALCLVCLLLFYEIITIFNLDIVPWIFLILLLFDSFKARFTISGGINFIVHPQLHMYVGFKRKF